MNDNDKDAKIIALANLIFEEVSMLVKSTDREQQAKHLHNIADYETRLNRVLHPEQFKTFAA